MQNDTIHKFETSIVIPSKEESLVIPTPETPPVTLYNTATSNDAITIRPNSDGTFNVETCYLEEGERFVDYEQIPLRSALVNAADMAGFALLVDGDPYFMVDDIKDTPLSSSAKYELLTLGKVGFIVDSTDQFPLHLNTPAGEFRVIKNTDPYTEGCFHLEERTGPSESWSVLHTYDEAGVQTHAVLMEFSAYIDSWNSFMDCSPTVRVDELSATPVNHRPRPFH